MDIKPSLEVREHAKTTRDRGIVVLGVLVAGATIEKLLGVTPDQITGALHYAADVALNIAGLIVPDGSGTPGPIEPGM